DKKRPEIKYVAPVSGEILKINRGEKRSIAEIVILADKELKYRDLPEFDLDNSERSALVDYLLDSGAWTMIRQRPFDIIADPKETPKAIFISTFDSAPLAPDLDFVVEGKAEAFQKGLDVLNKLTPGKVHLGLDAGSEEPPSAVFTEAQGVVLNWFRGPHPAGNVGVQIHHIDPIAANEKVWVLGVQEVITLGAVFTEGRFNAERIVALTGAEFKTPKYVATFLGAHVENFIKDNLTNDHVRLVSGDVLSGKLMDSDGFLGYFDDQITVLEEGDEYELFGWLLPLSPRPSISKTFPNGLFADLKFKANTNTHGEKRAFVVTGQYESMLPMDIYPQHLMKSILVNDYERMEGLGIYELSEEDVALCEFACTSKQPLQQILRTGLDMIREQS
ncbi:MAG: Na(+)-translocating NADH-quinone reductase subunit A, partial [Bacteroidota bacterium]